MNVQPTRPSYNSDSNSGFTLTELLVVLATLAILVALVLPAMASTHEKSPRAQCQSNLRQLWLATQLYADENHGNLPNFGREGSWLWDLPRATAEAITEMGARRRIMYCPASIQGASLDYSWNYSIRRALVGYSVLFDRGDVYNWLTPPKQLLTSIDTPMTNSTFAESELITDAVISDSADRKFDRIPSGFASGGNWGTSHLQGQLPAGGNTLYLDGHVDWRPFAQMHMWYPTPDGRLHFWF